MERVMNKQDGDRETEPQTRSKRRSKKDGGKIETVGDRKTKDCLKESLTYIY